MTCVAVVTSILPEASRDMCDLTGAQMVVAMDTSVVCTDDVIAGLFWF